MKTKERETKNKGITLIALVVTIVVLLILAGVSISMLSGEDGIINQAQNASKETSEAENIEKIRLAISEAQIGEEGYQELNQNNLKEAIDNQFNGRKDFVVSNNEDGTFTVSCLDTLKDYNITLNRVEKGIDWNEAMANAVAPESQDEPRNKGVIGIGTDGKPVDMDLWEYTILDDGTCGLNDENSIKDIGKNKGYLGEYLNGQIIGTIPQYISINNGKNYIPVTNMFATFCEVSELTTMPIIPSTVKILTNSFIRCSNLVELKEIPSGVEMVGSMFKGCTSITKSIEIPNGVKSMLGMFSGCTNLQVPPTEIPSSVENMHTSFLDCEKLDGEIIINANLTGTLINGKEEDFYRCFYGASLKENNVSIKLYLKENLYDLFCNNSLFIYNQTLSNMKFIKL